MNMITSSFGISPAKASSPANAAARPGIWRRTRVGCITLATAITLAVTVSGKTTRPGVLHVSCVDALYEAVNDAGNAGLEVVLAPGTYALTARDGSGAPRPNGGRLELQPDMSITGSIGHPEEVIIDASGPTAPSFAGPQGNTGVVRMGRSQEAVEWLTIRGAANAAACIETDLVGERTTVLRIAHVIAEGSTRGIDVRNIGPASAGRTIIVDLDDNELRNNPAGQGLRFVNAKGSNGAAIIASLQGNYSHDNSTGCLASNLASSGSSITIDSHADLFDSNRVGCILLGGITQDAASTANDSEITFTAHASEFANNVGAVPPDGDTGGLVVIGGTAAAAGRASRNLVRVSLWGTRFDSNQSQDVSAWGARPAASGNDNVVAIDLNGVSKQATALLPAGPSANGNSATISR